MNDVPSHSWLTLILAGALLSDALLSIRPPQFIRDCLNGVGFPRDWWWALIVIKLSATAGLVAGLKYPGIGFATNVAVIGYFLAAGYAHLRARFVRHEFWLNCLGMLGLATVTLGASYVGLPT